MSLKEEKSRKVFYWNCADDREHTHKRIEWSIENGMLVCINIKISEKLISQVVIGDIILAYEPKEHKVSKMMNGDDGKCMSCTYAKKDGRQSFTHAFNLIDNVILIKDFTTFQNYELFRNWYSLDKHNSSIECNSEYFSKYFTNGRIIYIFPTKYLGKLEEEITTNKDSTKHIYKYYGKVRKGFDSFEDVYLTKIIIRQFYK
jgi:hypothetical protein